MTDMLVKLYELPPLEPELAQMHRDGIDVRRVVPTEKRVVLDWVAQHFDKQWASECDVAFARQPASCFIAVEHGRILGFACYDATAPNFFGPTGVDETQRGRGIGRALLLACLHAMKSQGYAYGIIGGVGPIEFYQRAVGAIVIEGSTPGIYVESLAIEM
ncbi:MAG: GNAT family N-acetyltransferase [Caldilineales bacterium]|nr:GNAT family N-acetyltransferase [Caldilineales bacterium]